MKKIIHCFLMTLLLQQFLYAQQETVTDTSLTLDKIVVTAFEQNRTISCGTIVRVIPNSHSTGYNKISLVNAFNSLAGVRMEERSPGSYRINIRGSSLRSPFGVRNVKVYWNSIPVTDAGGNTYFNQFAYNNFSFIEIVKGPAGSMYGAGSGGVLLMHSMENYKKPSLSVEYITGSYATQNILASANFGAPNSRSLITYAHTESDGYRDHTKIKKDNASFVSQFKISDKQQLTANILYSNLFYETPGGLTNAEFTANLKQARPAAGGFPGAVLAKAAIEQKNFLAGINHQYNFTATLKNTSSIYGAFAQIQNPTFRNYERRNEPGFGGRTSFIYDKKINETKIQLIAGGELQEGFFNTQVSKNKNGNPDTLQTNDDIHYHTYSIFTQADINFKDSWIITAGASINKSKVEFSRLNSYPVQQQSRTYKNKLSPRLAVQKKLNNNALFVSVSKGFSPPTIAELLPSTGVISTFLNAEEGINYELGGRVSLFKNKLHLEATGFYFKLNNALVTRKDSSNADYYVNAGNTQQKGIEVSADYISFFHSTIIDYLILKTAYTFSNFKYGDFKKGTVNFSGKYLPGVPKHTIAAVADLQLKKGMYCSSTYYYAAKIFLDDANTVAASSYHLLGSRFGYKFAAKTKTLFNIYAGFDNLLNTTYSLGNDFNAAGGRFYNAAPKRNYYTGISFQWNQHKKQ
ncbi:TonB-dependent receptor [Ferruginibacter sp.]|nr:TonB-dependent receptor plug domain-containing protein [Ferruginibacter sp.]